jgi:organic radical activating enzyme
MFGHNPKRPPEKGDGSTLLVQEIFPTLQGEGMFTGRAAVFVRLGGCNLACTFCDTEFESFQPMRLTDVLAQCEGYAASMAHPLLVITGGEPLRQTLLPLCEAALARGFDVQIETNGTLFQALPDAVHIVCSPKATAAGYAPLRPDMLARTNALKFIISAEHPAYNSVPDIGQALRPDVPIYVQPMDEYDVMRNARNVAHTIKLAGQYGYHLSMQLHKMLGVA